MTTSLRYAALLGFALFGCTAGTPSGGDLLVPQQQAQVTGSQSGLAITASISAATLGEDCGGSRKAGSGFAPSGDCAPAADGGGCGGGLSCQQSNVQIAFGAGSGSGSAKVEILGVTLHDDSTGEKLDTLTASAPQSWNGNGYSAWDQTVGANANVKASYDLTAPAWSNIGNSYSQKYRLHVLLRIDGTQVMLQSTLLSREPQAVT